MISPGVMPGYFHFAKSWRQIPNQQKKTSLVIFLFYLYVMQLAGLNIHAPSFLVNTDTQFILEVINMNMINKWHFGTTTYSLRSRARVDPICKELAGV